MRSLYRNKISFFHRNNFFYEFIFYRDNEVISDEQFLLELNEIISYYKKCLESKRSHWFVGAFINNEDQLDSELDDLVEYYPVSTKVNSPKNNSPELIQPL